MNDLYIYCAIDGQCVVELKKEVVDILCFLIFWQSIIFLENVIYGYENIIWIVFRMTFNSHDLFSWSSIVSTQHIKKTDIKTAIHGKFVIQITTSFQYIVFNSSSNTEKKCSFMETWITRNRIYLQPTNQGAIKEVGSFYVSFMLCYKYSLIKV